MDSERIFMSDMGKLPMSLGVYVCNSETFISRSRYLRYSSFCTTVSERWICRIFSFSRRCWFQVALHPFHQVWILLWKQNTNVNSFFGAVLSPASFSVLTQINVKFQSVNWTLPACLLLILLQCGAYEHANL